MCWIICEIQGGRNREKPYHLRMATSENFQVWEDTVLAALGKIQYSKFWLFFFFLFFILLFENVIYVHSVL